MRTLRYPMVALLGLSLWGQPAVSAVPQKPVIKSVPTIKRPYDEDAPPSAASAEYRAVKSMATGMLKRFSPKEYYFLGLGHSPSKLIAFLQAISPELGRTFPASKLGLRDKTEEIDEVFSHYERHIEALIPDAVLKGRRKILLLDYSSGPSLMNFQYALSRYLRERGSKVKVETAAFLPARRSTKARHRLRGNAQRVYDGGLQIAEFDYGDHEIGTDRLRELEVDPLWEERVKSYREMMRSDKKLDGFIREHLMGLLSRREKAVLKAHHADLEAAAKKTPAMARKKKTTRAKSVPPADATVPEWGSSRKMLTVSGDGGRTFDVLSLAERQQLNAAIGDLHLSYPADRFYFLGVGQTSAPFVSFMQAVNKKAATYLPADGVTKSLTGRGTIRRAHRDAYFALFDQILPQAVKAGDRDLVLMKKTDKGRSLEALADLLWEYLNQRTQTNTGRSWPGKVVTVGFGAKQSGPRRLSQHILIDGSPELLQLFGGAHKALAPFKYHQVGRTKRLQPRGQHDAYQNKLNSLVRSSALTRPLRAAYKAAY